MVQVVRVLRLEGAAVSSGVVRQSPGSGLLYHCHHYFVRINKAVILKDLTYLPIGALIWSVEHRLLLLIRYEMYDRGHDKTLLQK